MSLSWQDVLFGKPKVAVCSKVVVKVVNYFHGS